MGARCERPDRRGPKAEEIASGARPDAPEWGRTGAGTAVPSGEARSNDAARGRAGFTFVEILLTLVILMVSVAPLMQLFAAAVEATGAIDEMRTAIDLSREEIEKIKNLALTEEQIKALGNVASPPILLNKTVWYTVRVVDPDAVPLKVTVFAFRDRIAGKPVAALVTLVSK